MSYTVNVDIYDTALSMVSAKCRNAYITVTVNGTPYSISNASFSKSGNTVTFTGIATIDVGGSISNIEFGLMNDSNNVCAKAQYDLTSYNLSIPNYTMLHINITITLTPKTD